MPVSLSFPRLQTARPAGSSPSSTTVSFATAGARPATAPLDEVLRLKSASVPAAAKPELMRRAGLVVATMTDANSPLRRSLPREEQTRRLNALFDLSQDFETTLASFPERTALAELPRISPPGDAQRRLDKEPAKTRAERMLAFSHTDRWPLFPLERWAVEGDKYVRTATRESTLAEGLSFSDIDSARPMSFFRDNAAKAGTPDIDLRATGKVQVFEVPPIEGVPPMELQAVLPRPFVAGRPTVVYMTEATSSPFDTTGKPAGTIGEFLGADMNGLGNVNVVLVRSPYQAEFPNGPRFTAGYDNIQASLAHTAQYLDHVVKQLRDNGTGPVIMAGYSLGGAYINQFRGWFDNGKPGSGGDFYIPMAAPLNGYGGLFDPETNDGKPTWWSASQLAPEAYKQQKRIASDLSASAEAVKLSENKVMALIPRWDEAIQGIDAAYKGHSSKIPGGHISGAVETIVPLSVQILGMNVTIPYWPAMGTVTRTHVHFRDTMEAFVGAQAALGKLKL